MWSYHASRLFFKCQRQCYYKTKFAHHKANDPKRREAYLLSKLQSLDAWRGSLVDEVISKVVVPQLKKRYSVTLDSTLKQAKSMFQEQMEFGLQHRIRYPEVKPSDALVAFHAIEYGIEITESELNRAWVDVEKSLTNFFNMQELISELKRANNLIPQRPLTFYHFQKKSVRAVPDLIVFFRNEPPLIIDWKVNTFGTQSYRLQLAIYANALARCDAHSDFPDYLMNFTPTDYRLLEVQLLTNQQRWYSLTSSDIESVDSYIAGTAAQMDLALNGDDSKLTPSDFPITQYPEVCQSCPFLSLCREESE